jgi:hypothetical protein
MVVPDFIRQKLIPLLDFTPRDGRRLLVDWGIFIHKDRVKVGVDIC